MSQTRFHCATVRGEHFYIMLRIKAYVGNAPTPPVILRPVCYFYTNRLKKVTTFNTGIEPASRPKVLDRIELSLPVQKYQRASKYTIGLRNYFSHQRLFWIRLNQYITSSLTSCWTESPRQNRTVSTGSKVPACFQIHHRTECLTPKYLYINVMPQYNK
jgi:hypothetical protein